jgi:hypothetical protein
MITVYISVGNSDDRLTQQEWFTYLQVVDEAISETSERRHGLWYSASRSPFQNACWCVELTPTSARMLQDMLRDIRREFQQDSIAWAVATTEFV